YVDLMGGPNHRPTWWDMALGLSQPGQTVYIKIITTDDRLVLRGDKWAVTAGDDQSMDMLCGINDANTADKTDHLVHGANYVLFEAYYDPANPVVSINIGLVANEDQPSAFSVPIFIDPNIKNNG